MKADISKKSVSISYLNEAIDKFIAYKNAKREDMYIIMSRNTMIELECRMDYFDSVLMKRNNNMYIYKGIRIAIDDSLEFGEIDIR